VAPVADGEGGAFRNRHDAGRRLAPKLAEYRSRRGALVLALPRGGVPVGYEIALALGLPLDAFEVRKLGVPGHSELAMGAIGSGGAIYLNEALIESLGIPPDLVSAVAAREQRELERRDALYRDGRPQVEVAGKTVILVDDGLATGASMHAAVAALRRRLPARVVIAVPVAPAQSCRELRAVADEVVCLLTPPSFYAVGSWYDDFRQVGDDEVRGLLGAAAARELFTES
jgi:putative phosphoribosyl transferase